MDVVRHWAHGRGFGGGVSVDRDRRATPSRRDYGSHGRAAALAAPSARPRACSTSAASTAGSRSSRRSAGPPRHRRRPCRSSTAWPSALDALRRGRPQPAASRRRSARLRRGRRRRHPRARASSRTRCWPTSSARCGRAARSWSRVPNFGHWYPRGRTALGRFDYDQRGPLDRGHVRFFTRDSIESLIAHLWPADHRARHRSARRSTTSSAGARGRASGWRPRRSATDRVATRVWPRMFGYQFLYRLEVM